MSSLSEGSVFKERFAVIDNGKLIVFKAESNYLNLDDAVMKPFKLEAYRTVTHPRDVALTSSSNGGPSMFSISGHNNLSVADAVRKDYNLKDAISKYRFNIVSKVLLCKFCTLVVFLFTKR